MAGAAFEANKQLLDRLKSLLKNVILPVLDDQTLVTFECVCESAPELVAKFVQKRGIVLRGEMPVAAEQKPPTITLLDDSELHSFHLSMKGSLESGLLCAMRHKNLSSTRKDASFTHKTTVDHITLRRVINFCEVASSEDDQALAATVEDLAAASIDGFVDIIQAAESLEIEGLLRKLVPIMAERIRGKTTQQLRPFFGFSELEDTGYAYNGDYDVDDCYEKDLRDVIKRMKHFLQLLVPTLDNDTYVEFACMTKSSAKLVNDVQSRYCFIPGNRKPQTINNIRGDPIFLYDCERIFLLCSDGKTLLATDDLVSLSGLIKNLQLDHPSGATIRITLKSTTSVILTRIIKFCFKHCTALLSKADLDEFDSTFLVLYFNDLLDLALAAHTLKLHGLLDLVLPKLLSRIHHKKVEDVRLRLGFQFDFSRHEDGSWSDYEGLAYERMKKRVPLKGGLIPWEELHSECYGPYGPEPSYYRYTYPTTFDDTDSEELDVGSDGTSSGSEEDHNYVATVSG